MTNDSGQNSYPWRDHAADTNQSDERKRDSNEKEKDESTQRITDGHTELPSELSESEQADPTGREKKRSDYQKEARKGLFKITTTAVMTGVKTIIPLGRSTPGAKDGLSGFFHPGGMLRSDEVVVFEAHPTWLMNPKNHLIGAVLMSAAIAITVVTLLGFGQELWNMPLPGSGRAVPSQWWIHPMLLFFVGGVVYLYATIGRASTWYILTQDRLLKRKGVIRRQDKRISLTDINKTHTTRPPHMYPFGVGHIDIFTAATSGSEVRIEACRKVNDRSELIDYQSKIAQMTPEERQKFAEQHTRRD